MTLLLGLFTVFPPEFIRFMDGKIYDMLLRGLPAVRTSDLPLVAAIDDRSLKEYGQWPWPRYRLAKLIEKIHTLGAAAIGLDLILAEPDRSSIAVIRENMSRDLGVVVKGGVPGFEDNDEILARCLKGVPTVLGYKFLFSPEPVPDKSEWLHPIQSAGLSGEASNRTALLDAADVILNLPSLNRAAASSGFVNAQSDADGVLRRVPLLMKYKGHLYPSLALACLMDATKNSRVMFGSSQDGPLVLWAGRRIPLDHNGNLLIRFRGGRKTFPYVSAADILSDHLPPEALKGRIVFLGSYGSGLGDWHLTPFERDFPGTEVHANVIDNLLNGDFLYRPAWAPGAELFSVLVLGFMLPLLLLSSGAVSTAFISSAAGGLIWSLFAWLFRTYGIYLSPVMPLGLIGANFAFMNLFKYGLARRRLRLQSQALIQAQDATILSLAALSETRDEDTGGHIRRTQLYVRTLARRLAKHPLYRRILDARTIVLLSKCAPLHDIGKVGIPDRILLKPGRLTAEEFEEMKAHCLIGGKVFEETEEHLKASAKNGNSFLRLAKEMAESHHEKWDGKGYPRGLKGEEIPLCGRLMALADTYDALISKRVYKGPLSHREAKEIILEGRGTHFDPVVVDAFLEEENMFRHIAEGLKDPAPDL